MNRERCRQYAAEWRGMSDDAKEPYREIARAERLSRDLAGSLPVPAAPEPTQQDTATLPPRVADESALAVELSDSVEAVIANAKTRIKQTQLARRAREAEECRTLAAFHAEHVGEIEIPSLEAWSPGVHACVGAPNIGAFLETCPRAEFALWIDSVPVFKTSHIVACTLCYLCLGPKICTWYRDKSGYQAILA